MSIQSGVAGSHDNLTLIPPGPPEGVAALPLPTPSPLSAAAEEALLSIERSVEAGAGPPGDPLRWLSALIDEYPETLGASHDRSQLETLREMLAEAQVSGRQYQPISKEEIAGEAGLRAGKEERPIASSQDVAFAVLVLVTARTKATEESGSSTPRGRASVDRGLDGKDDPCPSDHVVLPASMATEEMLENLCTNLGIAGGGPAEVFRWLDVLLAHHEVVVGGEGGNKKLLKLRDWFLARAASGDPSPTLSSHQVRGAAARYAQEVGQSLVTPQDVAIAIVKLAVGAFKAAEDDPSEAPPPKPNQDEARPATEGEPPKPNPEVTLDWTALEEPLEMADAPEPIPEAGPPDPEVEDLEEESEVSLPGRGPDHPQTRTFRLFVSSTFADLQAERNALQEIAFPRLEEFCARHGARFQAIDLRWGVSEEAGIDQQTMNICLGEIQRCHQVTPKPNFLVLLGDRYGWIPPPAQVPADEFEQILDRVDSSADRKHLEFWYRKDLNAEPPEYRLQPRSGDRKAYHQWGVWEPEERRIRETLQKVVGETGLGLPPHRLNLYQASATEQEVRAGALEVDEPTDEIFCFFREIKHISRGDGGNSPSGTGLFISAKPKEREQLRSLKNELRKHVPESCILESEVGWGDRGPELTDAYLAKLADWIAGSLEEAILRELEQPAAPSRSVVRLPEALRQEPALAAEVAEHLSFASERRRFFVGREDVLEEITEYIRGNATTPLAIVGEGGTGKSALMAEAARRLEDAGRGEVSVVRFVGATPGSSDGRVLLESLCREIALQFGSDPGELPNEYNELVPKLAEQCELATQDQPLVLMVDSLDQLAPPASWLAWIPSPLPRHVRLVVSSRPDEVGDRLRSRGGIFLELGPLSRGDGENLLRAWLGSARPPRRLQSSQMEAVLDAFVESEGNPLYLKLATEEALRWPSWAVFDADPEQPSSIRPLARGVRGIISENLLSRLAHDDNHGWDLVSRAISYLSASRYGLAEDELIQLLSRDPDVYTWFLLGAEHMPQDLVDRASKHWGPIPRETQAKGAGVDEGEACISRLKQVRRDPEGLRAFLTEEIGLEGLQLPVVLWSRLFFDLDPYLTERRAEGGDLLSFYHRELGDVAAEKFMTKHDDEESLRPLAEDRPHERIAEEEIHGRLAAYFLSRADPRGERAWDGDGVRGLSELPYHLSHAGRLEEVYETLTDFVFLEQKAARVGVVEHAGGEGGEKEKLYTGVFRLQDDFALALQVMPGGDSRTKREHPLIVTAVDFGNGMVVRCPWCNTLHPLIQSWLGEEISCPKVECGGPLKVNSFTVGDPFEGPRSAEEPE